jgi:hypothetical protein
MENTSSFLFDNVDEKYFLAIKGKAVGPLTAQEVYERIQAGEAGLLHYFWTEGWSEWKRVCDEQEFAVLVPQKPSTASIEYIRQKLKSKKPPAPSAVVESEARNYYLYFNATQYGPFSRTELDHVVRTHKLAERPGMLAYLWTPGWANWKRMSELPEFAEFFERVPPPPAERATGPVVGSLKKKTKKTGTIEKTIGVKVKPSAGIDQTDKRNAPRRPLVARLFLHNDQDVIIAVCRDISVGGMQVLTDRIPGPVGSKVKLNVSPGDAGKVKGFVAEGEIVRVLEDGRGFSFRFSKITDDARKAIAKYIKSDA